LHAAIFIRCLPLLSSQDAIDRCLQNLFNKFGTADQCDQQVVYEALSPYLQSESVFFSVTQDILNMLLHCSKTMHNRSSITKKYFDMSADQSFSSLLLISNMYLAEIPSNFHECIRADDHHLYTTDQSIIKSLFQFESPILKVAQALIITNILSSTSATNPSEHSKKFYAKLNNALYRVNLVEFKACHLVESWMKWKDSDEFVSFANHAALLLVNSDFWSVEVATIVCDLLCSNNDCFRQKAEIILRSLNDDDIRTSSKLGIDVLLTLAKKKAHYQHTSPFGTLTLYRMFDNITIDIQSHLDSFLWLERYRIHVLTDKEYSLNKSKLSPISRVISYFPTDITMNILFCDNLTRFSEDLMKYMCDLITSHFVSFVEIDGDTTADTVLRSHAEFVVSVLVCLVSLTIYNDETRPLTIDALMTLIETSRNDEIRRAAAYALGYVCNKSTYKILFNKL
jgi:hypothetical protein